MTSGTRNRRSPATERGRVQSRTGYVIHRNRRRLHDYDESVRVGEHVFVPRPGSAHTRDGWLMETPLDARRVEDAPPAQA